MDHLHATIDESMKHPIAFPCGCVIVLVVQRWGWHQARHSLTLCPQHEMEAMKVAGSVPDKRQVLKK